MTKRISSIMDTRKKKAGAIIACLALALTMGTSVVFATSASAPITQGLAVLAPMESTTMIRIMDGAVMQSDDDGQTWQHYEANENLKLFSNGEMSVAVFEKAIEHLRANAADLIASGNFTLEEITERIALMEEQLPYVKDGRLVQAYVKDGRLVQAGFFINGNGYTTQESAFSDLDLDYVQIHTGFTSGVPMDYYRFKAWSEERIAILRASGAFSEEVIALFEADDARRLADIQAGYIVSLTEQEKGHRIIVLNPDADLSGLGLAFGTEN